MRPGPSAPNTVASPVNVAEILDGAGACPPEDCGGPHRYMALVKAQRDAADPDHDDAVELLGLDYDAGPWQGRNALAVRSG
ncbi:MAG: Plasmid pRiA4b ORF-3-like protein [Micromonosporaceae bacterium]|nr:Plasmid pRiA4b ORF-3-like protein [Micromonosporaceae bacterium]